MKVLVGNKFYFEVGGTERYVFLLERLLLERGHKVVPFAMRHPRNNATEYDRYFVEPVDYDSLLRSKRPLATIQAALRTVYSAEARTKLQWLIQETHPDVAHLHNIYHQISPSILPVLRGVGVPVVLTLHDLKLLCPGYRMYNKGETCERCLTGTYFNAARHRCLKNSFAASLVAAVEASIHAKRKTYERNVTVFIAPSRFMQSKISQSRFRAARVEYLPHPIDLNAYQANYAAGPYFVYFGRLTREKGLFTLLRAIAQLRSVRSDRPVRLVMVGDGPERRQLEEFAHRLEITRNVEFAGFRQGEALWAIVRNSAAVVVPSEWYENAPFSVYESYALGKAVVASYIGGIPELVAHAEDGLLFPAGNVDALAEHLSHLADHPSLAVEMGRNARHKAETHWGFEQHYQRLRQIYEKAIN